MHIEDYGVNYHCEFSGRFSEPIQLDDHVYSSKIERLDYKYEVGTEGYIDGYFYVFTDTCGLKIGDEVLIYTSDVCVGDLPAEIINWCYPFGNEKDYLTPDMLLEKYVIWDELGGGIFLYYM